MKKGKSSNLYYEGSLSDGTKRVRLFGFNELQQKRLLKFNESQQPVNLTNCAVRPGRVEPEKFEICIKPFTGIDNSPKQFAVKATTNIITLDKVKSMREKGGQRAPPTLKVGA